MQDIYEKKLYRASGSFEVYAKNRWEYEKTRIYQLLGAARLKGAAVAKGLPAPRNEGSIRHIAGKPVDEGLPLYEKAVELAGGVAPTEAHVKAALGKKSPAGLSTDVALERARTAVEKALTALTAGDHPQTLAEARKTLAGVVNVAVLKRGYKTGEGWPDLDEGEVKGDRLNFDDETNAGGDE